MSQTLILETTLSSQTRSPNPQLATRTARVPDLTGLAHQHCSAAERHGRRRVGAQSTGLDRSNPM